jgi:hypothetical protein
MTKNTFLFYAIAFAIGLTQVNCSDGTEDVPEENEIDACRPCDNAINFFRETMNEFGCTANDVQTQFGDMENACGASEAQVYKYLMAETCDFGNIQSPTCFDYGKPSANVVVICTTSVSSPPTETYSIQLACNGNTTLPQTCAPGQTLYIADFICRQGDTTTITVSDVGGSIENIKTLPCTFVRPINYTEDRYIELDSLANITCSNWE